MKIAYGDFINPIIEHMRLLQDDFVIEKSIVSRFQLRSYRGQLAMKSAGHLSLLDPQRQALPSFHHT